MCYNAVVFSQVCFISEIREMSTAHFMRVGTKWNAGISQMCRHITICHNHIVKLIRFARCGPMQVFHFFLCYCITKLYVRRVMRYGCNFWKKLVRERLELDYLEYLTTYMYSQGQEWTYTLKSCIVAMVTCSSIDLWCSCWLEYTTVQKSGITCYIDVFLLSIMAILTEIKTI